MRPFPASRVHAPGCGCDTAEDVLTTRPDLGDMPLVGARLLAGLRESA